MVDTGINRLGLRPTEIGALDGLKIDTLHSHLACADEDSAMNAMQLERYLRFYDASQILVVDQDDLMHRRDETVRRVFEFVGVDPTFTSERFDEERNTRADKRRTRGIGHHMWYDRVYPTARRFVPRAIRQRLKSPVERALYTPVTATPVLTDEMRERLVAFLRPDVEALRQMTGQQFASWSV